MRVAIWFVRLAVVHFLCRLAEHVGIFSEDERFALDIFLLVIGIWNALKRESEGENKATAEKAATLKKVIGFLKNVLDLLHKEL